MPPAIAEEAELALGAARLEAVPAEFVSRRGRIADSILAAAAESGADLIVLYRHTRGSLGRSLLGSVSQEVMQRATVPVLLSGGTEQFAGETG